MSVQGIVCPFIPTVISNDILAVGHRSMSARPEILERYRMARTLTNIVHEQQETLYHRRQRMILESSRTSAYKHALIQSRRRERPRPSRHELSRPSFRLSSNIRRAFQVNKDEKSDTPQILSSIPPTVVTALPTRTYPPTVALRQVTGERSMNMDILHELSFLGQFDRKFLISTRILRTTDVDQIQLILFDQHAISERILLEHLQAHFRREVARSTPLPLSEPVLVPRNPRFTYSADQVSLLERIGFVFSSISTHHLLIRAVPGWLPTLGQRLHRPSATSLIEEMIGQTIDDILVRTTPHTTDLILYETLKSLACHNAVKFNDPLSSTESQHLIDELKLCAMPFICAHGRTSAALLWEYDRVPDTYQVNMTELEELASIHKWLKDS